MPERDSELPTRALEDIAYLSRSANRVVILTELTEGQYSRGTLANQTDVSRATLDRIINELEERGWAKRTTEGNYAATAHGQHLMRRFKPFIESVETLHRLDDVLTWLPIDELSIGLEHFNDAVVRRPESEDPVEAIGFINDLLGNTSEFRVLAHLAPPEPLGATLHERVTARQMTMNGVITDELVEFLGSTPKRAKRWRALVEAGSELRQHEGPIPCNLWIFDETVLIKKSGPEPIDESYGVPIVSENDTVRSWAHDLIDEWMNAASPIDASAFEADPTAPGADSSGE
ncbi:putative transcriptional regulator, GntR family [Haloterrigena turkmenica DSM 5511]|uniref:Transcriptional regulator, GntR family n=1 Tax=Haloterrigena turkmenica (strain ATCC 51198 / DSM 5511 / JCM 9101 / NCIMB 13204 / VKM B-1734 / 4k) TaxID=543526 RepID=D2RYL1_HALTV|nr:winged helix-turn-helix domain-containing protein [Haloterrigena turkmenica]ADB59912.1 putative transcriptional regulator, GntR family [Haloterrigena turkmenica DSM 5511]